MSKTVTMMGVLALAATTALAQSTTTTSDQTSGTSGQSSSGQSTDKDRDQATSGQSGHSGHSGHSGMASDSASQSSSSSAEALSSNDQRFIEMAARTSMAEVELGKLAGEKASSPEVKTFGQMMVDDHTKAKEELKTLAQQKGVTLPTESDSKHQSKIAKLQDLSGAEFDKAFMKEMVKDHKKSVKEFKKAAKDAKDDDVKQWAAQKVPALEQHLQQAQQTADMGTASGGTQATGTTSGTSTSGSDSMSSPGDSTSATGTSDKSKQKDNKDKSDSDNKDKSDTEPPSGR